MGFFEGAQKIVARSDRNNNVASRDAGSVDPGFRAGPVYLYVVLTSRLIICETTGKKKRYSPINHEQRHGPLEQGTGSRSVPCR